MLLSLLLLSTQVLSTYQNDPGLRISIGDDLALETASARALGVEVDGLEQVPEGLEGPGLRMLGPGAVIAPFELGQTWCIEFWVRPQSEGLRARLNSVGASLYLADSRGRESQLLQIGSGPVGLGDRAASEGSLELPKGQWSQVALVMDLGTTGSQRLVVNGEALAGKVLSSPEAARGLARELWPLPSLRVSVEQASSGAHLDLDELRIYDRFVNTAELKRQLEARRAAGDSAPTARVLTGPALSSPETWAAGSFEQAVPGAAGVEWVEGQWTMDHPIGGPHARTCHSVVALGGGKLLVFGGELRDTELTRMGDGDDVWIYDMDAQSWERVGGGVTGRFGRDSLAGPAGPAPGPRCHIGMAGDPTTGICMLVAGWFNAPDGGFVYSDAWTFDAKSSQWTRHESQAKTPATSDVQPVFHEALGRFFFMMNSSVWSMAREGGPLRRERDPMVLNEQLEPLERRTPGSAMTWYDPTFKLIVRFGGFWVLPGVDETTGRRNKRRTNEVLVYSHENNTWILRKTPAVAPSPRTRGAVAYDTRRKYEVLFGGITGGLDSRTSDLWTYDLVSNTWTERLAANAPGKRGGYFGMAYDEERDEFIVPFGRQDQQIFLDEVWRLRLRPEASGTASWRFDRQGWPAGLVPHASLVPADGSAELPAPLVVRYSEDGVSWGDAQDFDPARDSRFVELEVSLAPGTRLSALAFE